MYNITCMKLHTYLLRYLISTCCGNFIIRIYYLNTYLQQTNKIGLTYIQTLEEEILVSSVWNRLYFPLASRKSEMLLSRGSQTIVKFELTTFTPVPLNPKLSYRENLRGSCVFFFFLRVFFTLVYFFKQGYPVKISFNLASFIVIFIK